MRYHKLVVVFILFLVVSSVYLFLNSCGLKGLTSVGVIGGPGGGQPPMFAVSSFKMTGNSVQPNEFSFGYYNNNFDPFVFANLQGNSLVNFSFSANFNNQIAGKKVIILGTGFKYLTSGNPPTRDVFWVGKIVNNPVSIINFTVAANNYKTVGGRNFIARFNQGAFDSNFDSITLKKIDGTDYNQNTDLDNVNEDFRSVAFKPNSNYTDFAGAMVGRNVAFYSSVSNGNFTDWQNALANTVSNNNKPSDFIGFDVIQGGLNPISFTMIGSDIGETKGELRVFQVASNSWSVNYLDALSSYIGPNVYPLYSSDYVSNGASPDVIAAALIVGKNLIIYWGDNNNNGVVDPFPADNFAFYLDNNVTFYGGTILKDSNNKRIVVVGYDDTNQEAVIYRGVAQDGPDDPDPFFDTPPTKVNISGLGLNLKDSMFFDVNSVNNTVVVVGVDLSNCPIKPYPQPAPVNLPKLTKSLIFINNANPNLDNDIQQTFANMTGLILISNDGGNSFSIMSNPVIR